MIQELDNALKELLIREAPLRRNEVDVNFDQPKREWSSQLNKPTINLFLFDIKENVELRGSEQLVTEKMPDGSLMVHRNFVRVDLFYLITAWTRDVQDQHRLLSSALVAFFRCPTFPADLLPERLKEQPAPIQIKVAQPDVLANITDLWSTLDNEIRPGIRLTITISISPFKPEPTPVVEVAELRVFNANASAETSGTRAQDLHSLLSHTYHIVSGKISSGKHSLAMLKLVLREKGKEIFVGEDGAFILGGLKEGEYHVDILANGRVIKQQKFLVPSSSYDIEV